jgi:hypothetical protein
MASSKKDPESAASTTEASAPAEPSKPSIAKTSAKAPEAAPEPVKAKPETKTVLPPSPEPQPAPLPPSGPRVHTYRVWAQGGLKRNGKRYKPGDTLELREDEAASIACLEHVKP